MPQRNIVVLLCDQLRPDFLSIYGGTAVPTPNLDRLAREGVVFDRAITQSTVCAPARASMMTGRYVSDHQVWTNDVPFRDGLETIAERMNELGYATGAFGKLHHFPATDPKGFRHVRQMEEGRLGPDEPYLHWLRDRHPAVERVWNYTRNEFDFAEEDYYEHWVTSEAVAFISSHADGGTQQPFLAWVAFQGPHGPFDPPSEVRGSCDASRLPPPLMRQAAEAANLPEVARYREAREGGLASTKDIMRLRLAYAEMIVAIDRQIGRLLERLEALGLWESTSIVFSADHGDMLWDFGLTAKGPFPYQAQLGIPMVIANDPRVPRAGRSSQLVGNIDIPGTLLEIAGASRGIGVSRSLIDLAQEAPKHPREVNFSEFCDSIKTVEDQRHRFAYYPFTGDMELHDLQEDPQQLRNLAGQPEHTETVARFLRHVIDFTLIARGVRVEAHDFVPGQQAGLSAKHPTFAEEFPVAFPASRREIERLHAAGLATDYNEFCRHLPLLTCYGKPYWEDRE